jgi:hypothetical protein
MNRVVIICVSILTFFLTLSAQITSGRISGTVTDPSGASVPGAFVTVRNTATQATRKVTTDASGNYVVENLPIGPYSVTVDNPGFRSTSQTGYEVTADARITANVPLQVGEAT